MLSCLVATRAFRVAKGAIRALQGAVDLTGLRRDGAWIGTAAGGPRTKKNERNGVGMAECGSDWKKGNNGGGGSTRRRNAKRCR